MKPSISSREDIQLLIERFYSKVREDLLIGFIFNDIAKVDWPHHLPIMVDFWETTLQLGSSYKRNPMPFHIQLNKKVPLAQEHFDRWIQLFEETVDDLFEGEKATLAKARAKSIAVIMQAQLRVS